MKIISPVDKSPSKESVQLSVHIYMVNKQILAQQILAQQYPPVCIEGAEERRTYKY
jgi:hypothetical protein